MGSTRRVLADTDRKRPPRAADSGHGQLTGQQARCPLPVDSRLRQVRARTWLAAASAGLAVRLTRLAVTGLAVTGLAVTGLAVRGAVTGRSLAGQALEVQAGDVQLWPAADEAIRVVEVVRAGQQVRVRPDRVPAGDAAL